MILLIILFYLIYLLISYFSIYFYKMLITNILRIILGLGLVFFTYTAVMHVPGNMKYWITLLALCLFMNVEISAYKNKFNDAKARLTLNVFSVVIAVMTVALIIMYM